MKNPKLIAFLCAILAFLLASVRVSLTSVPPPGVATYSGSATITTANCSGPGGLCQGGVPANCNNGKGPNNGAGTPTCSGSPSPSPSIDNCPACNNGAGPNPLASPFASPAPSPTPAGIQATVTLCEIRGELRPPGPAGAGVLTASGYGTGFQFGKVYISLLYKNPNQATCSRFPAGVFPTLENAANPNSGVDNDFASMMLGFWKVYPDGSATLDVVKQETVTGLNNYYTVSVREIQPPNTTCFNCGLDPAPQLNALRACGPLTVTAGGCPLPTPSPIPTP